MTHASTQIEALQRENAALRQQVTQLHEQLARVDGEIADLALDALHALPQPMAIIRADGIILAINAAWDDFARKPDASDFTAAKVGSDYFAVCRRAAEANVPGAHDVLAGMLSVLRGEQSSCEVECFCLAPGEGRWYVLHARPVVQHTERYLLLICTDITVHKRTASQREAALEQLLASETFNQAVFNNSPIGISVRDRRGRLLVANTAWRKIWAIPESAVQDDVSRDRQALNFNERDEYLRPHQEEVRRVYEHGGHLYLPELKTTGRRPGAAEWVAQHFYAILGAGGQVDRVVILTEDITARKQAEEVLRQNEARLLTLFEHSPISVWEEDFSALQAYFAQRRAEGIRDFRAYFVEHPDQVAQCAALIKILDINQTSVKFFEAESKADIPKNLPYYFTADSLAVFREELIALAEGQTHFESEIPIHTPRGKDKTLYLNLMVVPGCEKTLACVLVSFMDITERKEMEAELLESQTRYQLMFEHSGTANSIFDTNCRLILQNNLSIQNLGMPPAEALGKTALELFGPTRGAIITERMRRVFSSGVAEAFETEFDLPAGKKWFHSAYQPVFDERHKLIGIQVISRDITQRKQTEMALRESQQRFSNAFEYAPIGMALVAPDGRWLKVNRAVCQILGYTADELLSTTFQALTHPDDLFADLEYVQHMLRGEISTYEIEKRYFHKSGSIVWALLSVTLVKGEQGQPQYFISQVVDITERKRAEEALDRRLVALTQPLDSTEGIDFASLFNLAEIQRLQDEFAEATGVASIITHTDGTPITAPSKFCRLCNDIIRKTDKGLLNCFKSDAALGQKNPDGATVQPCLSGGLWDAGAAILVGGKHIANWLIGQVRDQTQTEEKMRAYAREIGADEEEVVRAFHEVPAMSREQFSKVAQVLFTLANQLSGIAYQNVQQARFIAARRQAEREIRQLNTSLEQRVADRTHELAEANARLQELDVLKSKFVSDVSHELRTPVTNLGLYLNLLEHGKVEKREHYLKMLNAQTARLGQLIEDILDLSQLERETAEMIFAPINLNDLIERVALVHQPRAEAANLQLICRLDPDLPLVSADSKRLEQVITNLVANAVNYTAVGQVQIVTWLEDTQACMAISDSGAGIDAHDLPHLFERFYRGERAKQSGIPGTGLGLGIVREIVTRHGGTVVVESQVGRGSTFTVRLPVKS